MFSHQQKKIAFGRTCKMKVVKVYYYEAFSNTPQKGNPAGVVFDADDLSEEEMQMIAGKIGFNETAFVMKSETADYRIRFFTPRHEMNLCGHGTVSAIFGLMEQSEVPTTKDLSVETLAGVIQVNYNAELKEVQMSQTPAQFIDFNGDVNLLASSIGITLEDIDEKYPIVYGNTGIWTLILPIKRIETFLRMLPKNKQFPEVLTQIPTASIHPICLETYNKTCDMHGRHFSSPHSGTVEDPVTGTASGVMGAYYITYIKPSDQAVLKVEQGYEIGKKGLVHVFASKDENKIDVSISGNAVYLEHFLMELN